jgi:hypothetical protein
MDKGPQDPLVLQIQKVHGPNLCPNSKYHNWNGFVFFLSPFRQMLVQYFILV